MLIGIDASRAGRSVQTGTERYSSTLIRHLLTRPDASQHRWRLYVDTPQAAAKLHQEMPRQAGDIELRLLPARRLWTHRALAREVLHARPDVLFVPAHVIPFVGWAGRLPPTVVTVHDLGFRSFPQLHTRSQRSYLEWSTRWNVHAARAVICVSAATAHDVMRTYGTSDDKLHVVHEAPIEARESTGTEPADQQDSGFVPIRPYALYVGTIQPRKNLARVLHAYARLVADAQIEWDLVLVGAPGWHTAALDATARELTIQARVHFTGYLPDATVDHLLGNALFFCFPSLFEGFGLPVLEAQQKGVPVLTSTNSSLPEVAGDGALLVDPTDVDAIAAAMLQLSRDPALRQRLIAAGHENVQRFSWEKAAAETLAVLEAAAQSSSTDA
ncbi:MAG: glycosyltransferase family 4 protein [Caldilineaceae bacterium]|nr:glycosyltransferase family 4 protein [Caldilineaceae bacterium]